MKLTGPAWADISNKTGEAVDGGDRDEGDDFVDMTVGETIAEGWWYSEGGGPISWNGSKRVADLGNGNWALLQSGDDGKEFVEVEAPATAENVVGLLSSFALESYTTHAAIALEPLDPDQALSPAVRDRISALMEDWAEEHGAVIFNVGSAITDGIRDALADASDRYREARDALRNPLDEPSGDFFTQMLDGIDTWDDILNDGKASTFMRERARADKAEAEGAEQLEKARQLARNPATQPPQLRELLRAHGQGVWSEVEANPNVTRALLGEWATSGPNEILEFVAHCKLCNPSLVRVLAERASSSLGQELMDFPGAEVEAIEGLLQNPDPKARILVASDGMWSYEDVDEHIRAALMQGWRYLADDTDSSVQEAVTAAWKQNLDASEMIPGYLAELAGSDHEADRMFVLKRDVVSAEVLANLPRDPSSTVRAMLARRSDLEPGLVASLLHDDNAKVRGNVARFQGLNDEQYRTLAADADASVREQVANRPATPDVVVEALADDEDVWVRVAVAGRMHLHTGAIDRLISDPDPRVRRNLAANPMVDRQLVHELGRDPDSAVRESFEAEAGTS